MQHMLKPNYAIILPKRVEIAGPWSHILVSSQIVDHVAVSLKTIDYCFPLYLYEESVVNGSGGSYARYSHQAAFVFEPQAGYSTQKANLNPNLLLSLKEAFKKEPPPESIFNYIYAILYSNAYRSKYSEFLKTDFPRVPFTCDKKLFQKVSSKGAELVDLHLLKSKKSSKPRAKCEGTGDLKVVKVLFNPEEQHVHVNPDKYFTGIPLEVWEYRIGGYQVAQKWLKDRKGRELTSKEVVTYTQIVTSIAETIRIQESLDDLFNEVEANRLEVSI